MFLQLTDLDSSVVTVNMDNVIKIEKNIDEGTGSVLFCKEFIISVQESYKDIIALVKAAHVGPISLS